MTALAPDLIEVAPAGVLGLSDAQRAVRQQGLGASEVAAVLGLDPRRTPWDIWADRRGLIERTEPTGPQEWGHLLEPLVAEHYLSHVQQSGSAWGRVVGTLARPHAPWAMATPDRIIETAAGDAWLLEVKTRSAFLAGEWGEPGTDEVPDAVAMQGHWQMLVTGLVRCDVAVLIGGSDYRVYSLRADAEFHAELFQQVAAWWHTHHVDGVEPAISGERAAEWVKTRYRRALRDDVVPVEDEMIGVAMRRLAQVKAEIALLEADERDLSTGIKAAIGDRKGLYTRDGFRAVWSDVKGRTITDWEAVARAAGASSDLIREHTRISDGHRMFRLTAPKELR